MVDFYPALVILPAAFHRRLLAGLLLLALVLVPPLALALPSAAPVGTSSGAGMLHVMPTAAAAEVRADDCHGHGDAAAKPQIPDVTDQPCKAGCAACGVCIFVQAALPAAAAAPAGRIAAALPALDHPASRPIRRSHPPLRPPRI